MKFVKIYSLLINFDYYHIKISLSRKNFMYFFTLKGLTYVISCPILLV
jgi:hypothetical protein